MNTKIRSRYALVFMMVVGGLLIYTASILSPGPNQNDQTVQTDRCSDSKLSKLNESFELSMRRKLAGSATQKQVLLNTLRQHSEFSDCTNVIDQTVAIAKQLVAFDTSSSEKAEITFALLHALENNQAVYQLTDIQRSNAIGLAELNLQFIKDTDYASQPDQIKRYRDLSTMLSMAMENSGRKQEAEIWKQENLKYAPANKGV